MTVSGTFRGILGLSLLCTAIVGHPIDARAENEPLAIRITSPLGRTNFHGTIRIVAQVQGPRDARLQPVRFSVDQNFLGEDAEGPPFSVDWVDEQPFEPREIGVEVCVEEGACVRDSITLDPLEIVDETSVASVLLEATVQDENGRYVRDLPQSAFTLTEDDTLQTLDLVQKSEVESTYILMLDSSQSMNRRIAFVRLAAMHLLRYLKDGDRVIVAPFTKTLGTITGPTNDLATVSDAIMSVNAKGGTAILDALADLPRLTKGIQGRLAVVLMTDGYDEHSARSFEDAMRGAKAAQSSVYVVGIGGTAGINLKGEDSLRRVAIETGGRAFFPTRETELPAVHDMVAADIQQRYLLAYTPSNQVPDGAWRSISVTTNNDTHRVRTRTGYFAPKPAPVKPSLEFTVTNRERQPVELSAEDLVVLEDGVPQQLETFQEAVAPVSIVMALDASGSMKRDEDAVKLAAHDFVDSLRPEDKLALMLFANEVNPVHKLTTARTLTNREIETYVAAGGTALYDGLVDALTTLETVDGRRAVVVVTDGRDENAPGNAPGSLRTFDDVIDRLRNVDAVVYAIGMGPNVDRDKLIQLAQESGGEAFFPESVGDLPVHYSRVVEHLRRRYVFSYESTNPKRDGGWRAVEITAANPDLAVTSRGGYFAPDR